MNATTCTKCGRAVYDVHVNGEGRCCYCGVAPPQKDGAARPASSKPAAPRPVITEAEGADLGRKDEE